MTTSQQSTNHDHGEHQHPEPSTPSPFKNKKGLNETRPFFCAL